VTTATMKWTDPTTRVDGTALAPAEIASIDIFDSAASNPAVPIGNVPGGTGMFTTGVLSVGDHTFSFVVNDTTGHKSASAAASPVTVPATLANPSPVSAITVTLNP
jgi:hypothetical protein